VGRGAQGRVTPVKSVMTKTVLFWNFNIDKGDLLLQCPTEGDKSAVVARVVQEYDVDMLVLDECRIPATILLNALQTIDPTFEHPADPNRRFKFFTRFPGHHLEPWLGDGRLAVRRLQFEGYQDILMAVFHYLDRRNNRPLKQHRRLKEHTRTLLAAEQKAGHDRTILFGDLNMNPYEIGMLDPESGLGAMMTWDLATIHGARKGDDLPRFYNPMWSVMGRAEVPGTFYWDDDDPENTYWHCLDGVLLRPALRESFRDEDLRIIRWIPGLSGERIDLIRLTEVHWRVTYSDQPPILFKIDLAKRIQANIEDSHA
jgi:Endonuclease/Exonuclease/phosphatase family